MKPAPAAGQGTASATCPVHERRASRAPAALEHKLFAGADFVFRVPRELAALAPRVQPIEEWRGESQRSAYLQGVLDFLESAQ